MINTPFQACMPTQLQDGDWRGSVKQVLSIHTQITSRDPVKDIM